MNYKEFIAPLELLIPGEVEGNISSVGLEVRAPHPHYDLRYESGTIHKLIDDDGVPKAYIKFKLYNATKNASILCNRQ